MKGMDKCDVCMASGQSDSLFCQECQMRTVQRRRIADRYQGKEQYEIKMEETEICRN